MGGKVRINITVDPETVRLADCLAQRKKSSRSAILREGVRVLAENHQREMEEAKIRGRRGKATEGIRRIARKPGEWPSEAIVHAFRYPWEKKSQLLWKELRRRK
jgi:predicted transcriptional regulator